MEQQTMSFLYVIGGIALVGIFLLISKRDKGGSQFRDDVFDRPTKFANNDEKPRKKQPVMSLPAYVLSSSDPHRILGVDPDADEKQIKNAYKRLIRMCHPDKFRTEEERKKAQDAAVRINQAKDILLQNIKTGGRGA